MNFYAQMPDAYSIVLNTDHRLVKAVLEKSEKECEEELKPVVAEIKGLQARFAALGEARKAKKPEEVTQEEKDDMTATEKKLSDERAKKLLSFLIISTLSASNNKSKQIRYIPYYRVIAPIEKRHILFYSIKC